MNLNFLVWEMQWTIPLPVSFSFAWLLLGTSLVIYLLLMAIYNILFHPLAQFPGPWLAQVSDYYLVFVICSVPTYGHELHKRYGEYSLDSPETCSCLEVRIMC